MKKYVDLDAIIDRLDDEWGFLGMREELYNLPVADVVEDKSGAWENMNEIDSAYVNTYHCSACGTTFWIDESPEDANYNYCPNCGAKMSKGQEC